MAKVYSVRVSRFIALDVIAENVAEAEEDAIDLAGGIPDRSWETDAEVQCSTSI